MRLNQLWCLILSLGFLMTSGSGVAGSALADNKERVDRPLKPVPVATPEMTVGAAIAAGLSRDFQAYLLTIHKREKETEAQRGHLHRYQWKRFQGSAGRYVREGRPDGFTVVRRDESPDKVVLFLQDLVNPERMAVPVRLERDGKGWGIVANSL